MSVETLAPVVPSVEGGSVGGGAIAAGSGRLEIARRALDRAEAATGMRATLPGSTAGGDDRFLRVPDALAPVVPFGGLRRGSVVRVEGSMSFLLDLAAAASRDGVWCAVVGLPDLGLAAAAEAGLALDRVAFVPRPEADAVTILGAVVDGYDLVVVGDLPQVGDQARRRISSRVRHRSAVLLSTSRWPEAELVLSVSTRWAGVGEGDGRLREREVSVRTGGRGVAAGNGGLRHLRSADGIRLVQADVDAATTPGRSAHRSALAALDRAG